MENIMNVFEKVWSAIMSFDIFSDLLDILLVTFVIYEGIRIIRGSRTFQLVKGIGFLLVVYFLVKLFDMEASEYILSTLFKDALIILVVLFSPELRNILEKFGRRSFSPFSIFGSKASSDYKETVTATINNFCKAVSDLSETKTGALVVFEREAPLRDIINSGTILDAKSSTELFNGIFFKNSALHDGAVVVRDGRIYSAGCILPLTQNSSLASELGTRHRAAIGMSEQSDAVVVVVSEETGAISVACGGVLTRDISKPRLREFLMENMLPAEKESEKKLFGRKNKDSKKSGDGDKNEK